jgi:hypothetical protein
VVDGNRVEAFLSDRVLIVDPHSVHGRMAVRAYAYSLASEGNRAAAKALLAQVGREG